jgi:DNA-binding CsgD family transcriptional regulator
VKAKDDESAGVTDDKTRVEQAEARTEQAEARTEQAKSRTELAETRTEQAETRTEQAKTRTEQAEIRTEQAETRTEQAETALEQLVQKEGNPPPETATRLIKNSPADETAGSQSPLEQLTARQREILQLIAEGQNTKQIADILKVSPKTVEYHRMKLMAGLNLHDVPGLVRYAVRVGLISAES